ncbi:hypothetical protein ETB97_012282 [Aspergillus alliaceus]|uniref:Uncharacterized protein n=1 Tax=Petromyces alliaceus TaxID=209559 RepID=A0A8H6E747_PETAA|nr:hypothetical protein ETB97_012282 [Aspergillus burnettii]
MALSNANIDVETSARADDMQHTNRTEGVEPNSMAMHGFKLYTIFIGIYFSPFMKSLDVFVIATAIPSITAYSEYVAFWGKATYETADPEYGIE